MRRPRGITGRAATRSGSAYFAPGEGGATVVGSCQRPVTATFADARLSVYFLFANVISRRADDVRSAPPVALLISPLDPRVISRGEPGVELANAAPFATLLERPLAQPRLNALLLAVFAAAAVVLAAVGLFGVMAAMVRQRTRELGVRMALGATAASVQRLVLRRGMVLAAVGASIGVLGALAGNQLLSAMLFEVSPTDGLTLALATVTLLGVAALASLIPARSSTRIEPAISLQAE